MHADRHVAETNLPNFGLKTCPPENSITFKLWIRERHQRELRIKNLG